MEAYVEYKDEEDRIHRFNLRPEVGFKIVIGRSPTCNLRLNNRLVGRNHGSISFEDNAFVYHDMGSVNGSVVNNEKVSTHTLKNDDVISIGNRLLTFHTDMEAPVERPVRMPTAGLSAQVPMLKKENDALRKRCNELSLKAKQDRQEIDKANKEKAAAITKLKKLEKEVKKFRDKDVAYSVDLHSLVDRNKEMAEKMKFQQGLLEKAREEVQDMQARNNTLHARLDEATEQTDTLRKRLADYKQRVEDLKVKMTQAQREIDQIQRDNDIKEYDIRTIRDENDILREKASTLEANLREQNKKVRDFEVIIEENRGHMDELRRHIQQKNDEIDALQSRLRDGQGGTGDREIRLREEITGREREVEELRGRVTELSGRVSAMEQEKSDLTGKIAELQEQLNQARKTPVDISDHPEYKEKLRNIERMNAEMGEMKARMEALTIEVDEAKKRAMKAVETRLGQMQQENDALKARNIEINAMLGSQPATTTDEGVRVYIEELSDTLIMLKDSFSENKSFFRAIMRENVEIPATVFKGLGVDSVSELEALLADQLRLLDADIKTLKSEYGG